MNPCVAPLLSGIQEQYRRGETDYALSPVILAERDGSPVGLVEEGDAVIFCCRRGEREIQLTEAFVEREFAHFPRKEFKDLLFVCLTRYHEKFRNTPAAFAPVELKDTLGEVISRHGLPQLHVAESEKFAHVTFFFNGCRNQPFRGEEDINVPSPRGIPFEEVPELSARGVGEAALGGMERGFGLIVVNFANGDVIGHVPGRGAKIKCAQVLDKHLGELIEAATARRYVAMVTADHGALEVMIQDNGAPNVGHTANPVPFLLVDDRLPATQGALWTEGRLADVAPTVLDALGLPKPEAMTGRSLFRLLPREPQLRVLLIILDGWGLGREDKTNPIFLAETPEWDRLRQRFPFTRLEAAGEAVGLRPGMMGNSEAGHVNIGSGRVVLQDDVRLERALKDGSFDSNEVFRRTLCDVGKRGSALHLLTLLSKRSSHGTLEYPLALLRMAKERGLKKVFVHVIFDGRSTEPGSSPRLLEELARSMTALGIGQIVSGVGRGFALDRDRNYAKTRIAYDALVFGKGKLCRP